MISTPAQYISTGEWTSRDEGETFEVGRQLGLQLRGGEILLLDGPLGAGKTIFVKGLAAGLDVDADEVTSPSFTLVNPYRGRLPFFHIDLYRLDAGATAAHAVDLDELLGNESAVIVIEWAARLGKYPLPPCVWHIKIQGDGDAARNILISYGAQQKD
ncbi:MAG: tRNA (adenosine(37)-N6)-threonylcarbamoyltransferase complex ATPase subunit type 1 TsaE [Pyrinomonadaceae bacterium]